MQENKTYRIRTKVGDETENVINVKLDQHYDSLEILSLKIDQENFYKTYESDYGVVVGRVIANGGFGVPNAKVSIFIESDGNDDIETRIYYPYKTPNGKNSDGVRYNLLTDFLDKACYQNVGTFPNKRLVLDNDDVIDVFDKYYRYTTVTNNAGDYMIFGVPTGSQRLHVDVDLSDIGMLSQRPRDMVYKGYDINLFDSPNKFKQDKNLDSLAQIKTQDVGIYVYPYWGDTSEDVDNIAVTRADIQLDYKFEPTCVFMGSIITDTGSNAIGKNCTSTEKVGKMSELIAGEGSIEMIRKTYDGKVEEFQVKGNRVIDGDGVWCYQIPMNLDYIMTDEFGNIAPSDNPDKGIPTRTKVRFRISLDDAPDDNTARKRCKYLVPNNPRLDEENFPIFTKTKEPDYEFGTRTRDESYVDLLWNKVYTVKNYVPRLQKNRRVTDRKHTGIKLINHHEGNNPMPYNNVDIKLGFTYRLLCVIFKIFINLVQFLNQILTALSLGFCSIYKVFNFIAEKLCFRIFGIKPLCWMAWPFRQLANLFKALIVPCVGISSDMCSGNTTHNLTFYPGCGNILFSGKSAGGLASCITSKTAESHNKKENKKIKDGEIDESERTIPLMGGTEELYNCVETALAEDNDTVSLNFQNDWVNGTLYAPMWFRKITKKRSYLFGLIRRSAKDEWCEGEKSYTRKRIRIFNPCSPKKPGTITYSNFNDKQVSAHYMNYSDNKRYGDSCRDKCHEATKAVNIDKGLIVKRQTMLGQDVYYYKPVEFGNPPDELVNNANDYAVGEAGFGDASVKILFATDIVLLGSLNDCDIHGVPQFFRSLEATTFQLPPNILFTDNEINVTMSKGAGGGTDGSDPDKVKVEYEVTEESVSEMTGMDWGNFNEDLCGKWNDSQDSGLFYSIGCSTIKMKPKSCINMTRICEFGVSLDETKQFKNAESATSEDVPVDDVLYDTIVPDGFISKDELYNDDERSMFATLNVNGLHTDRNTETGLMEYTFKHVVVDNFDKSLYEYMSERQRKCASDKTQRFNYILEEFSKGYYDFRMGEKPYFYDKEYRLPRYENSFYFYFGLNPGKTAIDKFNSQFTSDCNNANTELNPIEIETVGNSWCSEMNGSGDGYVAFNLTYVDLPCDIVITNTTNISFGEVVINNNEDEMFYISKDTVSELEAREYVKKIVPYDVNSDGEITSGEVLEYLPNGVYEVVVTDNNGEIITTSFNLKPEPLSTYIVPTDFYESDVSLMSRLSSRNNIARNTACLTCNSINDTRGIGGTIGILKPYNNKTGEPIESYKIQVVCDSDNSWNFTYVCSNNIVKTEQTIYSLCNDNSKKFLILGLPKGNETYTVTIVELCGGKESNNIFVEKVKIQEKSKFKLYINGTVDYDVIKHWKSGFKIDDSRSADAITQDGKLTFTTDGKICNKWWHMSNPDNYMWSNYEPFCDIDKSVCSISDTFKSTLSSMVNDLNSQEDSEFNADEKTFLDGQVKPILSNCVLNTHSAKHFFYTESTVHANDSDYACGDSDSMSDSHEQKATLIETTRDALNAKLLTINDDENMASARSILVSFITLCDDAIELLDSVDEIKTDFINETKSAFQLTCSEYDKSIYFTAETKDKPVTYHGVYLEEEMNDTTGLYTLVDGLNPSSNSWKAHYTNEGDTVDVITIPTITYRESAMFGHEDTGNNTLESKIEVPSELCLARDNSSTSAKSRARLCNFIAVINGRGNTIPNNACIKPNLSEEEACGHSETGFADKTLTCNYFGYHIIDKVFEIPHVTWSYINGIPYYKPTITVQGVGTYINDNKAGVSMCMNGLFAGKVFNGSANIASYTQIGSSDVYETGFVSQTIGRNKIKVVTVKNNSQMSIADMEDEMPTRRYIIGENIVGESAYDNYKITDQNGSAREQSDNNKVWDVDANHQQYVPVVNGQMNLILEDESGCQITDTIDGRMKIALKPTSLNVCDEDMKDRKKGSRLDVTLENGGNSDDVLFMVFNITNDRPYPLNYAEEMVINDGEPGEGEDDEDIDEVDGTCMRTKYDCMMSKGASPYTGGQYIFKNDVRYLFSYFNDISDSNRFVPLPFSNSLNISKRTFGEQPTVEGLVSKYVDENAQKEKTTYGYSNTGEFTFKKLSSDDYENAYYVVAVTSNNMRTISPVYDFCYLCSKFIFGTIYTKVEATNDEGAVIGYDTISAYRGTFDIGNVVNGVIDASHVDPNKIKYYFYYYPYDIEFEWKIDDTSTISGSYTHTAYKDNPDGYVLFDMDEDEYNAVLKKYKNSKGRTGKFRKDATVKAVDVTGLNHQVQWVGCKGYNPCDSGVIKGCTAFEQKTWVTVTWVTGGGEWVKGSDCTDYIDIEYACNCESDGHGNCTYGTDGEYTRVFTVGETYNPYKVGQLIREDCNAEDDFEGWSDSYDSRTPVQEDRDITITGDPEESVIYYAIWKCDFIGVTWVDCDGTVIKTESDVKKGSVFTNDDMPETQMYGKRITYWWVEDEDHPINLKDGYIIDGETTFHAHCAELYPAEIIFENNADLGSGHSIHMGEFIWKHEAFDGTYNRTHVTTGITLHQIGDTYIYNFGYKKFEEDSKLSVEQVLGVEDDRWACNYLDWVNVDDVCEFIRDVKLAYIVKYPMVTESSGDANALVVSKFGENKIRVIFYNGYNIDCNKKVDIEWRWGYDKDGDGDVENDIVRNDTGICYGALYNPPLVGRNGYTFIGWFVTGFVINGQYVTGNHQNIQDETEIYWVDGQNVEKIIVTAEWGRERVRVDFNTELGDSLKSVNVEVNSYLQLSQFPTKEQYPALSPEGKQFNGRWMMAVSGDSEGTIIDTNNYPSEGIQITSSTVFTALFDEIQGVNVTFKVLTSKNPEDGTSGPPYEVIIDERTVNPGNKIMSEFFPGYMDVYRHMSHDDGEGFDHVWVNNANPNTYIFVDRNDRQTEISITEDTVFTAKLGYYADFKVLTNVGGNEVYTSISGPKLSSARNISPYKLNMSDIPGSDGNYSEIMNIDGFPEGKEFNGQWKRGEFKADMPDASSVPIGYSWFENNTITHQCSYFTVLDDIYFNVAFIWNLPDGIITDIHGQTIIDPPVQSVGYGNSPTAPSQKPEIESYEFGGWVIDGDQTETVVDDAWVNSKIMGIDFESNITFKAAWKHVYKIDFKVKD